jgi:hypothetical protein
MPITRAYKISLLKIKCSALSFPELGKLQETLTYGEFVH